MICICLFLTAQGTLAQSSTDFIDLMREGGKIYVVYLLLGIILLGILIYLAVLERRLAGMEKQLRGKI